ncbi:MAG: aldehyde ferredoxin oxidoreductase [Thermoflexia bacterium]|nr:MAG: aldehyde ferredoxin oxidoreductase [Thermoflexia bacterium]
MSCEIWRLNLRTRTLQREPVPSAWQRLGGRGLIARIVLDEVPSAADPLGPFNKLILAPGLLGGHLLSSCDRVSVGGKGPLTGTVKEANAGGRTGLALARLGIRALILEDQAGEGWWVLHVSAGGVRLDPAGDLAGLGVYAAAERLRERYGKNVAAAIIGPAGERRMRAAAVLHLDADGIPGRASARGGVGALMGSRGLKAIVIDAGGRPAPPVATPQALRELRARYVLALQAHPQTQTYHDYGTAAMVAMCNAYGGLPTRGFSQGRFEGADAIGGEALRDLILERGGAGNPSHACMPGCIIRCSNVVPDRQGRPLVSPLEYETIALMGSNLGLDDLDTIAHLNWHANDIGVDTIEVGAALGVAARGGIWSFGDGGAALRLMDEIRRGTPLGRILGNGAAFTGQAFGVLQIPAVKGQAIAAYDPRAIKGTGVTYATSPQGADHTAGLTIRAKIDPLKPEGQAAVSRRAQVAMAGYDTLGVCIFAGFGISTDPGVVPALLNAIYGWDVGDDILTRLGEETIRLERAYNRRVGFGPADDRIPEWMTREPLPPHNTVFDVPASDLDDLFADLEEKQGDAGEGG